MKTPGSLLPLSASPMPEIMKKRHSWQGLRRNSTAGMRIGCSLREILAWEGFLGQHTSRNGKCRQWGGWGGGEGCRPACLQGCGFGRRCYAPVAGLSVQASMGASPEHATLLLPARRPAPPHHPQARRPAGGHLVLLCSHETGPGPVQDLRTASSSRCSPGFSQADMAAGLPGTESRPSPSSICPVPAVL